MCSAIFANVQVGRDAVTFFVIVGRFARFLLQIRTANHRETRSLEVGSSYITGSMLSVPRKGYSGLYPGAVGGGPGVSLGFVGLHEERMPTFAGACFLASSLPEETMPRLTADSTQGGPLEHGS